LDKKGDVPKDAAMLTFHWYGGANQLGGGVD